MKVHHFLARDRFPSLLEALAAAGYEVIGPQVRDHAIVFAPLASMDHLPRGIIDDQAPGHYRLERTESERLFDWTTGPQAIKPLTFAPRETLWKSERQPDGRLVFRERPPEAQPTAVIAPADVPKSLPQVCSPFLNSSAKAPAKTMPLAAMRSMFGL